MLLMQRMSNFTFFNFTHIAFQYILVPFIDDSDIDSQRKIYELDSPHEM